MTDKTQKRRTDRRRAALKKAALVAGWESWSAFETAVVNGKVKIPKNGKSGIHK